MDCFLRLFVCFTFLFIFLINYFCLFTFVFNLYFGKLGDLFSFIKRNLHAVRFMVSVWKIKSYNLDRLNSPPYPPSCMRIK